MSKEKQGIDLLKFIGSIMIFTIHMAVFESFGEVQSAWELLGRWAVPVFFIASAYFLFSANNGSVEYANIKKYMRISKNIYTGSECCICSGLYSTFLILSASAF